MLLGEIRDYLKKRGEASLDDVALHFDIAPETAQFALNYWQQKGKVRAISANCGSSACHSGGCGNGAVQRYEWAQRGSPIQWLPWRQSR